MRYLENAFKFTFKNFLLTLPLLISLAIPALIINIGTAGFVTQLTHKYMGMLQDMIQGQYYGFDANFFDGMITAPMIVSVVIGGLLTLVFSLLAYPATYGFISRQYDTGNATLSDFTACMSKYIGRYVLYILLRIAIGLGMGIVLAILIAVSGIIMAFASNAFGIILMILFYLAFIVAVIALRVYMCLWFPAICTEGCGVTDGLKLSFKTVNGSFWPLLGITILISICGSIISSILGIFPFVGAVVSSVASTLAWIITTVYYFEVYRGKTGRFYNPEGFRQINDTIQ
ncbi:hypothetical protein LY28_02013 [Ruminiclostridium sufflavum DSM 19573]|uniref:Glycerophosphoryl diester phosphodiesterase family protein n=1 Tax=Ruminiclostridium sufflavum DSM 19573 TaxID=1121337 RepID=A0A318Y6J1_9FIRM|nr:hypothetical protein [Ruminiclostridium sufflavum]PYG87641.1 hypothetical protein LY28_02013 [Ruminiclostridium sufflavum DSM 19573]